MAGCKHASTRLVEITLPQRGTALSIQCNLCGRMLPRTIISDNLFDAWHSGTLRVPHIDTTAWVAATQAMVDAALEDDDRLEFETYERTLNYGR